MITQATDVARLLRESDEADAWHRWGLGMWRGGFRAGAASRADDYELGFARGILSFKRAQHDLYRSVQLEAARWGPRGREHFADPRPGDFAGRGDTPQQPPAAVWLGGPPVHRHECTRACRSCAPGPYAPPDAARILRTLPGGDAE